VALDIKGVDRTAFLWRNDSFHYSRDSLAVDFSGFSGFQVREQNEILCASSRSKNIDAFW
jgi:hypothetical protein